MAHWTQKISCIAEVFVKNKLVPLCLSSRRFEFAEALAQELYKLIKDDSINEINNFISKLEMELKEIGKSVTYTRMLLWTELASLINEYPKLNIGNHTYNHQNLGSVTDEEVLDSEISFNDRRIKEELDIKTSRFAFPNGECNSLSYKYLVDRNTDIIQLTEINFPIESKNVYYRVQPYHSSFEENIFRIFGFHEKMSSLVRKNKNR